MKLYYGSEKTLYEYNVTTFCVFAIPTYQNINVRAFSAIKQVIIDYTGISVIIHSGQTISTQIIRNLKHSA
jgi:hypothetical protein